YDVRLIVKGVLAQRMHELDNFKGDFFFGAAGRLLPFQRDQEFASVRTHADEIGAMTAAARFASDDLLFFHGVTVVEQHRFDARFERGPGLRADAAWEE